MGLFDFFSDVAGAVLGGSSGGGDTGDSTKTQEPWAGLQPYVLAALNRAGDLYNMGGPQYYPESTVIPFSPQSQLGMQMMENRILQGSPYQDAAGQFALNTLNGTNQNPALAYFQGMQGSSVTPQTINPALMNAASVRDVRNMDPAQIAQNRQVQVGDGLTDLTRKTFNQTMRGNYLNNNPYLDQTFNRASDAVTRQWNESVMPGVNSTFSLAGRTGSGAHQNAVNQASEQLGDTLSDLGNQIYGQNYQQERDRMMQAANSLGGFDTTEQGYGLQASTSNAGNALTRNLNQANLIQGARQFNVGFDQNRALTDAGYQQGANQFNAGQRQDTREFNALNNLGAQQFNQNFGLNLGNAMGDAYQQNVGNQFAASNLGMSLADQDFMDIGRMMGIGGMVEDKAGQYLQDNMNRFNYYQNQPYQNFSQFVNYLGAIPGSGFTTAHMDTDRDQGSAFADWIGRGLETWANGGSWQDMFKGGG